MFTKNYLPKYYFGEIERENQSISESAAKQTDKIIDCKEINVSTTEQGNSIFPKQDCSVLNISDIHSEPNLSRAPSPTSSITSNKKLEWDSGADIGYNIYDSLKNARKSKSYPLLTIDFSCFDEVNKANEAQVAVCSTQRAIANHDGNTPNVNKFLLSTSDMDTFSKHRKRNFQHSTPYDNKNPNERKHDASGFRSTEANSVGLETESHIKDECLQTTLIHQNEQGVQTDDFLLPATASDYKKSKRGLRRKSSGEISSESKSFEYISGHTLESKAIIEKNVGDSSRVSVQIKRGPTHTDDRLQLGVHVKRDKCRSRKSDATSKTDLKTSDNTSRSVSTLTSYTEETHSSNSTGKSSASSAHSDTSRSKSATSEEIPLGEMLTTQHSKNLIEDIDRSLYYLQKFIKSKQYNPITKKYYAKKIVTKIIQSRYSDDTSSGSETSECTGNSSGKASATAKSAASPNQQRSSSSEGISRSERGSARSAETDKVIDTLFVRDPPRQGECLAAKLLVDCGTQYDDELQLDAKIIESSTTKFVEFVDRSTSYDSHISRDGKPTAQDATTFVSCGVQCDELQLEPVLCAKIHEPDSREDVGQSATTSDSQPLSDSSKSTVDDDRSKLLTSGSSGDRSNKSWKEEKTLSERLFEAKQMYYSLKRASKASSQPSQQRDGPREDGKPRLEQVSSSYLIQYSKREKRRQLSWINNEIDYLRRLKGLLQTKDDSSGTSTCTSKDATDVSAKSDNNHDKSGSSRTASQAAVDEYVSHHRLHSSSTSTDEPSETVVSKESLKKLSKYFTNEQLKFLIQNSTSDFNCQCMCCRYRSAFKLPKAPKLMEKLQKVLSDSSHKSAEDVQTGPSSTVQLALVDKSCQVSEMSVATSKVGSDGDKTSSAQDEEDKKPSVDVKDVDVQCTIRKQKESRKNARASGRSSSESAASGGKARAHSDCLIFENMENFNSSRTVVASTTTVSSDFSYIPKRPSVSSAYSASDKENRADNYNANGCRSGYQNSVSSAGARPAATKPIAYLLTFEEVSVGENGSQPSAHKRSLEKVTVKVPKLRDKRRPATNKSNSKLTLQEYLCKNRPDFLEAAEWRRKCVANAKDCHNVFTCKEMKKITLRKYKKLPEVTDRAQQHRIDNERRYNRLQANVFSRKLQKKALQGQISLSTCISVMSPL